MIPTLTFGSRITSSRCSSCAVITCGVPRRVRSACSASTTMNRRRPLRSTFCRAYPMDNNFTEYPLVNETVVLYEQDDKMYYSRKVNFRNWPNNNLDFTVEGST